LHDFQEKSGGRFDEIKPATARLAKRAWKGS